MVLTESVVICGLGPILFLLYIGDVTNIALRCGLNVHSYADDMQLHVHCDAVNCAAEAARLAACIEELDGWMASNRLKLNADKTQAMKIFIHHIIVTAVVIK